MWTLLAIPWDHPRSPSWCPWHYQSKLHDKWKKRICLSMIVTVILLYTSVDSWNSNLAWVSTKKRIKNFQVYWNLFKYDFTFSLVHHQREMIRSVTYETFMQHFGSSQFHAGFGRGNQIQRSRVFISSWGLAKPFTSCSHKTSATPFLFCHCTSKSSQDAQQPNDPHCPPQLQWFHCRTF